MIDLGDRQLLDDGTVLLRDSAAVALLYAGGDITRALLAPSEDTVLHDAAIKLLDASWLALHTATGEVHGHRDWTEHWFTPEPWASLDMTEFCVSRCASEREIERACEELVAFGERGMLPALRHISYLCDTWRAAGVVWGVGRGSSVASFVLHILGINRINPLIYDLDWQEFLR